MKRFVPSEYSLIDPKSVVMVAVAAPSMVCAPSVAIVSVLVPALPSSSLTMMTSGLVALPSAIVAVETVSVRMAPVSVHA